MNQTTALSTTNAQGTAQSTLSYDDEGNLTHVGSTAQSGTFYTYDDADQLSQIVNRNAAGEPTSKSTFLYDGLKRLRVSRDFSWQNGAWVQTSEVRRVYDGMDVVQERDAQNNVLCTYTRAGNIGGILARTDGNVSLYYHYDGHGNVTQLTNSTQQVVAKYGYDAFGNTSASGTAASQNRYRFSTKEQIGGLYYYGYRFYSSSMGRWLNRDPIAERGGLNLYGFVFNNSVNIHDGDGRNPIIIAAIVGCALGAAAAAISSYVTQYLAWRSGCEPFYWWEVGVRALFGCIFGALGGILGGITGNPVAGVILGIVIPVIQGVVDAAISRAKGCSGTANPGNGPWSWVDDLGDRLRDGLRDVADEIDDVLPDPPTPPLPPGFPQV